MKDTQLEKNEAMSVTQTGNTAGTLTSLEHWNLNLSIGALPKSITSTIASPDRYNLGIFPFSVNVATQLVRAGYSCCGEKLLPLMKVSTGLPSPQSTVISEPTGKSRLAVFMLLVVFLGTLIRNVYGLVLKRDCSIELGSLTKAMPPPAELTSITLGMLMI